MWPCLTPWVVYSESLDRTQVLILWKVISRAASEWRGGLVSFGLCFPPEREPLLELELEATQNSWINSMSHCHTCNSRVCQPWNMPLGLWGELTSSCTQSGVQSLNLKFSLHPLWPSSQLSFWILIASPTESYPLGKTVTSLCIPVPCTLPYT